jgi:CDP-glucose 4,6-dehydratase
LQELGAELCGLAMQPSTNPAFFEVADVARGMKSVIADIREINVVHRTMTDFQPEIVVHMAAQALVRHSYLDPLETYSTNVIGTANVLESARKVSSVRAIVNVTTDKCYQNREWEWGYRENERMGGSDPYSSSKACAELISEAYRKSFLAERGIGLATARAGNVIGGGDWATDRLVPDVLRYLENENAPPVEIRNPDSIRPWQHVLEPLSGYLMLGEKLYCDPLYAAEGWNFGPNDEDAQPVSWIVAKLCNAWGSQKQWVKQIGNHPHEAQYLRLDISKARQRLSWRPRWSLSVALDQVVNWHRSWLEGECMRTVTLRQILDYGKSL